MGNYLGLVTLGDENIQRVLDDPPLIWRVIAPYDSSLYEAARARQPPSLIMGNGFRRSKRPLPLCELELSRAEGVSTDLDVAWRSLHYVLTGTSAAGRPPFNFLLLGGREVGDVDVGYGPARALRAEEVRRIRAALDVFSDRIVELRFNPERMLAEKVYPELWRGERNDAVALEYVQSYVRVLRNVLHQAAEAGVGLVVHRS